MRSILNVLEGSDAPAFDLTTLADVVAALGLQALDSGSLDDSKNATTVCRMSKATITSASARRNRRDASRSI